MEFGLGKLDDSLALFSAADFQDHAVTTFILTSVSFPNVPTQGETFVLELLIFQNGQNHEGENFPIISGGVHFLFQA